MSAPVLSVKNLTVKLQTGEIIVDDVSFNINEGEIVVISGANGCGKTTIIETVFGLKKEGKYLLEGSVLFADMGEILSSKVNQNVIQNFRKRIVFVSQRDDYESLGRTITMLKPFEDQAQNYSISQTITKKDVSNILKRYFPKTEGAPEITVKTKPLNLSGGQQRLLSIIAPVIVRKDAELFLIDEPLNNFDYDNMKRISDLINEIHRNNAKAAFLIITHCRIFPFVTKRIEMAKGKFICESSDLECYNCVGTPNEYGFYDECGCFES